MGDGLTPLDRFPEADVRIRRALAELGIQAQDPSGLTIDHSGIAVDPVAPITVTDAGVGIDIGNGLEVSGTDLAVDLAASNPGLQFTSGDLAVLVQAPVMVNGSGIGLTYSTGLYLDGSTLKVNHDQATAFVANEHIDWLLGVDTAAAATKIRLTAEGGFAIKLTNKTGSASVKGELVIADTATDNAVILTVADDDECFGVMYEAGVADGAEVWVVVSGIAEVLLKDSTASVHGNWVLTSDTAGRADATAATPPGAVASHFQEIGHALESQTAGTDVMCKVVMHFN